MLNNNPGFGNNFFKNALVWVIGPWLPIISWGAVHHKFPLATRLELEGFECVRETVGSPPFGKAVGLFKYREYFLCRGIKQSLCAKNGFWIGLA
jgi:hypothetical protein